MARYSDSRRFVLETSDVAEMLEAYNRRCGKHLRLGKRIASGGFGEVYNVIGTDTPQVMKVVDTRKNTLSDRTGGGPIRRGTIAVHPETIARQHWLYKVTRLEIASMQMLAGKPNVMPLCDAFEYADPFFGDLPAEACAYQRAFLIFMPKLVPLLDYIQKKPVSEGLLIRMAADICTALSACREVHIMHRDLKPDNIFVHTENGKDVFVLGDFGAARRMQSPCESGITRVGSAWYQSPEVYYGRAVTYSADVYSLGVTMYYLIAGKFPYTRFTETTTVPEQPLPLEHTSPQLAAVIRQAIQYRPEKRYASADELRRALLAVERSDAQIGGGAFKAAKQKLLEGKTDEALDIACRNSGGPDGMDCLSLAGYLLYARASAADRPQVGRDVIRKLSPAAQAGAPLALFLFAQIYFQRGKACRDQGDAKGGRECDRKAVCTYLRAAAKHGYVLAMYHYGRILYENRYPDVEACDRRQGLIYIRKACEAGYLDAMRILRRIAEHDPDVQIGEAARSLMAAELSDYDERRTASLIHFL